eukprot:SAG25_NODE_1219_length_3579_cov_4.935632_8_plen_127_part_00
MCTAGSCAPPTVAWLSVGGGRSVSSGITYTDTWLLSLGTQKWNQVRMKGQAPSPRCGFGLAVWKKTLIVFGGVIDEDGEETVSLAARSPRTRGLTIAQPSPPRLFIAHPRPRDRDGSPRQVLRHVL